MRRLIVLLALVAMFPAMADPAVKVDAQGNPLLSQFSEQGFVDCVFRVVDISETRSHYTLRLRASVNGEPVGFDAQVVKRIAGSIGPGSNLLPEGVYRGGVVFHRTGPESDRLVKAVAALYGQADSRLRMVDKESFTAIALHQGPLDLKSNAVKLKLFGRESAGEGTYYESYFNLDLRNRLVYWNEKDPDYRRALLKALAR